MNDDQLEIKVENEKLVISIGVDLLAHAVAMSNDWDEDGKIIDPVKFAEALAIELKSESGTSDPIIYQAIDKAAFGVVDAGGSESEGLEFND